MEIRAPNIEPAVVEYKLDNWATGLSALGINGLQSWVHIVLMAHAPSPKQDPRCVYLAWRSRAFLRDKIPV